jgi:hypothetical protein
LCAGPVASKEFLIGTVVSDAHQYPQIADVDPVYPCRYFFDARFEISELGKNIRSYALWKKLGAKFFVPQFVVSNRENRSVALRAPKFMSGLVQSVIYIEPSPAMSVFWWIIEILWFCAENKFSDACLDKSFFFEASRGLEHVLGWIRDNRPIPQESNNMLAINA